MNPETQQQFTYTQHRQCLCCKRPIADQASKARKFCVTETLPDGSIRSCHDDYNAKLRVEKNEPYKFMFDHHKKMTYLIHLLQQAKGTELNSSDINEFGIKLNMCALHEINSEGIHTFYFVDFAFRQIELKKYKIIKHDNTFQ